MLKSKISDASGEDLGAAPKHLRVDLDAAHNCLFLFQV